MRQRFRRAPAARKPHVAATASLATAHAFPYLAHPLRGRFAITIAAFDTYAAAKMLREAGFGERQAEAAVTMVRDAVTEGVATRTDTARIESQLAAFKGQLDALKWIAALHTALTVAIAARLFGAF